MFDQLTTAELHELGNVTARATTRLYGQASELFGQMSRTSIHAPQYQEMSDRAAVLMAAGREQMQLSGDVGLEIYERAEARAAAAMRES